MAELNVYAGNDYVVERAITQRDTATGAEEAAGGLSGVIGFLSLSEGGGPIHASLQVALTERSGVPGTYFAVIQGSDLTTHLVAALDGDLLWECVQSGSDYKEYFPCRAHVARVGE